MNFDRQARLWRVRETEYCLFHLEPPLDGDADLVTVIAGADARYLGIREVLGQGPVTLREREGLLKTPYWLYAPAAIADADLPPGADRFATGAGSPAGVVFAQRGFRWRELVDQLTHETVHVLWGQRAGQAPSLLNEGVAVYVEARHSARAAEKLQNLRTAWERVIGAGARPLRELCRNAGFWQGGPAHRGPLPSTSYRVGGALAGYLLEAHGVATLETIFRRSHYRDERLAATMEETLGVALDELQSAVGAWWRGRAADG